MRRRGYRERETKWGERREGEEGRDYKKWGGKEKKKGLQE